MVGVTTLAPSLLEDRLRIIQADPTLCHTSVRWLAHEAVYPGSGAAEQAERYRERDASKLAEVEASLVEFGSKAPDDEATAYLRWLRDELRRVAA